MLNAETSSPSATPDAGSPDGRLEPSQNGESAENGASRESKTVASTDKHALHRPRNKRWIFIGVGVVVLILAIPKLIHFGDTVSTDDAYVNSYVTFVAPRVTGQVARVLVDDNNRVRKGDVLVELDPEPYQVQVAIKRSQVDSAKADLVNAQATVRAQIAQTLALRFKLQKAVEDVDNQIAGIHANVATLEQSKASQALAQLEFDRAKKLRDTKVFSQEEFDQKREQFDVDNAKVKQALENVYQARAALGLPSQPPEGESLTNVPADLDQRFSAVQAALGDLLLSDAQLGAFPSSYNLTPKQLIAEFRSRDPSGNMDRVYAELARKAPALRQAEARLATAQRDLDQAELNLRYCTVRAEIDGVVTSRNVNPGNNVEVGQSVMAIRSLRDLWVDANFKETQLGDLRIGQRVRLEVDMYGSRREFEGRITGFTMGTGQTLALLPPQNATGNFVKIVQRLPVRVDLTNYDPDEAPLFVGLSVTPYVYHKERPTGPQAGQILQSLADLSKAPTDPTP